MSGVTPSWLQEIRDYWAGLAQEQREVEHGRRGPSHSSRETEADQAGRQGQPQMMAAVAASNARN